MVHYRPPQSHAMRTQELPPQTWPHQVPPTSVSSITSQPAMPGTHQNTYIPWPVALPENKSIFRSNPPSLLNISPASPLLPPCGHQSSPNPGAFTTGATAWVSLLCPTRQFSLQNTSLLVSSAASHLWVALLPFFLIPNSRSCKPRPGWSLPTS